MDRASGRSSREYYLRGKRQEFRLGVGECFIGRNPACDIVLTDPRASRNHAVLRVTERAVVLQDLDSANGVFLNDERIDRPETLRHGDRVLIGTEEFVFSQAEVAPDSAAVSVEEVSGVVTPPSVEPPSAPGMLSTVDGNQLDYLGRLADKMLALGRVDAAEKVLASHMHEIANMARCGAPVVSTDLALAARYAMKLAEAGREARWIDYAVRLYGFAQRPLPVEISAYLASLLPRIRGVDHQLFVGYQELLARLMPRLPENERQLCRQVLALPRPL